MNDQFPPIEVPSTRELETRAEVTILCEVRQGSQPWKLVRLNDFSQTGFRIAWLPDAMLSLPIRIKMPCLQVLVANIRWQKGKEVGCEFVEPLHIAVFEHILKSVQFNGPLSR